jgi:hypothetical protein
LRRLFGIETVCQKCRGPLHLISLIKSEAIARKILLAITSLRTCPSFTQRARRREATGTGGMRKTG